MPILTKTRDFLAIILMLMLIGSIALGFIWVGLGVYANMTEKGPPEPPAVSKASTQFFIRNTGNLVYSSDYTADLRDPVNITDDLYILNGYYEDKKGKYVYKKSTLRLDELTFGPIIVSPNAP